MSKATPADNPNGAPVPHRPSKQNTTPARRKPRTPTVGTTTQELLAHMWDTLEWRKTLQVAAIIAITGIMSVLFLAGLRMTAHAMINQAAAWPVSITVTATVSYRAARRRRR